MLGWGGGGWGGVGVLTFCLVRTVHITTLPRSLECLPRYMFLRCRDLLWYPCHVTCCYAAEISYGILATLHVATLQRSPVVSLLRYMLLRCRDLWNACHVTCCYAAEISYGGTMQLSKRVCCRSCLKRCGARDAEKN